MKDNRLLYFETTKYFTGMKKDARKEVMDKMSALAKECKYKEETVSTTIFSNLLKGDLSINSVNASDARRVAC